MRLNDSLVWPEQPDVRGVGSAGSQVLPNPQVGRSLKLEVMFTANRFSKIESYYSVLQIFLVRGFFHSFSSLSPQFVFIHGKRDLVGGSADLV